MIYTLLDAVELVLRELGDPMSPFWLASQLDETKLWRGSEHDVRAALEADVRKWGGRSQFMKLADDEWTLKSWSQV